MGDDKRIKVRSRMRRAEDTKWYKEQEEITKKTTRRVIGNRMRGHKKEKETIQNKEKSLNKCAGNRTSTEWRVSQERKDKKHAKKVQKNRKSNGRRWTKGIK